MTGVDSYFTPRAVADDMVSLGPAVVSAVTDPSAGEGVLLEAAAARYGQALMCGFDIDQSKVDRLRRGRPGWRVERLDVRDQDACAESADWRAVSGRSDLVLLNPPYSYRGGSYTTLQLDDLEVRVSPATLFVLRSLDLVSSGGSVVAILPSGILDLQKDLSAWEWIRRTRAVVVHKEFARTTFRGAKVRSILVEISGALDPRRASAPAHVEATPSACVELIRGRVPVFRANWHAGQVSPFLHTTDLRFASRRAASMFGPPELATDGDLLLIPRVGRPRLDQLARTSSPTGTILSDCVFAMRAPRGIDLDSLAALIAENFGAFENRYCGPCAPHITIARLSAFLGDLGIAVHHVPASAPCESRQDCSAHRTTMHDITVG